MDRRRFLLGSGVTFATAFAGCSARNGDDGEAADDDPAEGDVEGATTDDRDASGSAEDEREDGSGEADPITHDDLETAAFSGTGDEAYEDVELEDGLTALAAIHDGSRSFSVTFVGEGDEETMLRHIGAYDGAVADRLAGGAYRLEVEADGDWELVVSQPRASSGRSPPVTLADDRDDVYGPFSFDGSHTLSGAHDGEGNFIAHVLSPDGEFRRLVFNEIGRYDGDESLEYEGIGYVAVQADGEWSIDVE